MEKEQIIDIVLALGAAKAEYVSRDQIITSPVFRKMCQDNCCGMYGRCYMCPPDLGDPEELMQRVHSYQGGVLYQTIGQLEDSFDVEGMQEAAKVHTALSVRISGEMDKVLPDGYWHLSKGGCGLCENCAKQDQLPCRHPDKALGSLEGACIDVYKTCASTGLKYINGADTVTYFGLILY